AVLHAIGRGHAAGEFGEELAEHALAAVAVDDALVVDEVGRGVRDRALRHPGGDRLLFHIGEEAIETRPIVAGRRARRRRARPGNGGFCGWRRELGGGGKGEGEKSSGRDRKSGLEHEVSGGGVTLGFSAKLNGMIELKPVPRPPAAPRNLAPGAGSSLLHERRPETPPAPAAGPGD